MAKPLPHLEMARERTYAGNWVPFIACGKSFESVMGVNSAGLFGFESFGRLVEKGVPVCKKCLRSYRYEKRRQGKEPRASKRRP